MKDIPFRSLFVFDHRFRNRVTTETGFQGLGGQVSEFGTHDCIVEGFDGGIEIGDWMCGGALGTFVVGGYLFAILHKLSFGKVRGRTGRREDVPCQYVGEGCRFPFRKGLVFEDLAMEPLNRADKHQI